MKLRIITKGSVYVPQFCYKGYYGTRWKGFGTPNIKFFDTKDALNFVELVDKKTVPSDSPSAETKVIYKNYQDKIQK